MTDVLVVSHACVVNVNRGVFESLAQTREDYHVQVLAPSRWKGSLIRDLSLQRQDQSEGFDLLGLKAWLSGKGSFYFYSQIKPPMQSPSLVFIDEEPWSLSALQVCLWYPDVPKVFYTKQNLKKKLPQPFSTIEKYVFSKSVAAFCVSDEVVQVLRNWKQYSKPIHCLPHSYDPLLFYRRSREEVLSSRRKWGLADNAPVVGYFGRLSSEKGITEVLRAIPEVTRRCEGVQFLFVGNGPMLDRINEFKHIQKNVISIPALPHFQVNELMSAIDLLVLPSRTMKNWKEQFGRVIVEAMACGVPVVGSNSGEIPYLIRKTQGGRIFQEGNAADLRLNLEALLLDEESRKKLSSNGEDFVSRNFAHARVAEKFAEQLATILKPSLKGTG